MKKIRLIIGILLVVMGNADAQQPSLRFLKDSLGIGERVAVSLVYRHNGASDVFFPDEHSDFSPFEFIEKAIFPTVTRDSISTDSALFYLRTFQTEAVQQLQLPVWLKQGKDSISVWSNPDSVFFRALIPDSLLSETRLLSDSGEQVEFGSTVFSKKVRVLLGVVLAFGLLALFFKTGITTRLQLLKLNRRQREFERSFKVYMFGEQNTEMLSAANVLWRNYLEELEQEPYTSLSALEIEQLTSNEQVGAALRELESVLFGGRESDRIPLALQILNKYAKSRFREYKIQFKKRRKNG